jgi:ribosomal protein S18 acetylase RimI-like enzyme
MVSPDAPADLGIGPRLLADGPNVAWLGRASRPGERWVTGLGDDPIVVARLVTALADEHGIDGVTVIEPAFDLLPTRLQSPDPGRWCFWTLDPMGERAGEGPGAAVAELDHDDQRIAPLLEHSTSAHVFPGDRRIVRWVGVEDGTQLVSVAGMVREPSGAAHLLSVCTHPEYRGRGLARDTCRRLVDLANHEGAPMVVLEMYTSNDAGRQTYSALGFTEVGRYASGLLAHALHR